MSICVSVGFGSHSAVLRSDPSEAVLRDLDVVVLAVPNGVALPVLTSLALLYSLLFHIVSRCVGVGLL